LDGVYLGLGETFFVGFETVLGFVVLLITGAGLRFILARGPGFAFGL
jgi:hypothetical protein